MKWLLNNIEWSVLALNALVFITYIVKRPVEPGKLLYWGGAVILLYGVIKMKG